MNPWELFQEQMVRARKPHVCDDCGLQIAAGETYERIQVWCGAYAQLRYHVRCGLAGGKSRHWATWLLETGGAEVEQYPRQRR
jgi:hypothetical protein